LLLAERAMVKEAVSKACRSMLGLAHEGKDFVEAQIVKLAEIIQQLQARTIDLEAQTVLSTLHEVCNQREEIDKKPLIRIRALASE
jgi:hypothetical protein